MALTKVSTAVVDLSGSTGALEIAKGTTTERDAISSPTIGLLRYNTTDNTMEVYTDNSGTPGWQALKEGGNAFIPLTVEYLVVAGGGGGGGDLGGGGGAGGYLTNVNGTALTLNSGDLYPVTVGEKGRGAIKGSTRNTENTRGGDGYNSVFSDIISTGGGGGGVYGAANTPLKNGRDGGSGGGAGPPDSNTGTGGNGNTPSTTPSQGNNGGLGYTSPWGSGGGGGAGDVGQNAPNGNQGGDGGVGLTNSITVASGTGPYYAGGGGGADYNGSAPGAGGLGGGGAGGYGTSGVVSYGINGTANTGGGGGGGAWFPNPTKGGDGGSGVVILRYPSDYQINFTAGASPAFSSSSATVGTDTVTTITAGSGTITFS